MEEVVLSTENGRCKLSLISNGTQDFSRTVYVDIIPVRFRNTFLFVCQAEARENIKIGITNTA